MSNPTGTSFNAGDKLGDGYVNGMQVAWASTTTLTIAAGSCLDSTKQSNLNFSSAVTVNAAVVGANGIESGALANSTWYYIHAIWNSLDPENYQAGLISVSATAPDLPAGYDSFRLLDYQQTDGSALFLKNYNMGNSNLRKKFWDSSIAVLTSGTATSLTAISLASAIPPVNLLPVMLNVDFTPATANDTVSFAPFGSTATVLPHIAGSVAAKINSGQVMVMSKLDSTTPKILYINSAASGDADVWVAGFEFSI